MKDTKERIITESTKLFTKNGFAGTTVAVMGEACGISASSLFSHFKSKEQIYETVVDRYIANLQAFRKQFRDYEDMSLREFITFYISKVSYFIDAMEEAIQAEDQTQAQYFFFTMESSIRLEPAKNALNTFEKEDITMWKSVIDRAIEKGEIKEDPDSQSIAELFRNTYLGMAYLTSMHRGMAVKQLKHLYTSIYEMIRVK